MFDKMEWYTKHAKKLDKKYYAKGESIYVLHRRTLQTAKSIIDLINDMELSRNVQSGNTQNHG